MRREAFREYLVTRFRGAHNKALSHESARIYCAYVTAVEAQLGVNLDIEAAKGVRPDDLEHAVRLSAQKLGIPERTLGSRLSGLRAYSEFLDRGGDS